MNPDSPAKEDKTTLFVEEDDDASNQTELTTDATTNTSETPSSQPTLANILAAIGKLEEDITARFNGLDSKLHLVQTSLTNHATRITDLEGAMTDHDTRITSLERRCEEIIESNTAMKRKLTDLESRSRRSNIKIGGLPEKVEKGNPTHFIADLLPKLLGSDNFPAGLKVDRAHRIGAQSSARPRSMIAKIHHFPEKEKIPRPPAISADIQRSPDQHLSRFSTWSFRAAPGLWWRKKETEGGRNKTRSPFSCASDSHVWDRAENIS